MSKNIDSLFLFIPVKDVRHRVAKLEADRDKLQAQLNEAQAEREKSMKETEITGRIIMLANRLSTYRVFSSLAWMIDIIFCQSKRLLN